MQLGQNQLDKIVAMATAYGATRLILFGSAAEAPEKARDIDLACAGVAGWKLYELAARLEDEMCVSVDMVPLAPPTRFTRHIEKRGRVLI